jgi:hypothetical protein
VEDPKAVLFAVGAVAFGLLAGPEKTRLCEPVSPVAVLP